MIHYVHSRKNGIFIVEERVENGKKLYDVFVDNRGSVLPFRFIGSINYRETDEGIAEEYDAMFS